MPDPLIPRSRELAKELADAIVGLEVSGAVFTFDTHGQRVRVKVDVLDEASRHRIDVLHRRLTAEHRAKYLRFSQLRLNLLQRL